MNDPQPEGHMASHIERRKFLATLGGAAVAWPFGARAQQVAMPVVGFLHPSSPAEGYRVLAFRQGLKDAGFIEGEKVLSPASPGRAAILRGSIFSRSS